MNQGIIVEQWKLWVPHDSFSSKYSLQELSYKKNTLSLTFKNRQKMNFLKLSYENPFYYQYTNESLTLCTHSEFSPHHLELVTKHTFFTIKNSKLIQWLVGESKKIQENALIHFMCIEIDSYVEIITPTIPNFEWISNV